MLGIVPFADFAGGAHLIDQASELDSNTAIDLADVRFGVAGEVRSRPGTERIGAVSLAQPIRSMWTSLAGVNDHVLVGDGVTLRALRVGDGVQTASIASTSGEYDHEEFGAPGTERTYFANAVHFGYFDGAAFTTNPTITLDGSGGAQCPRPRTVAVLPWDNRLLAAGYSSAGNGPGGAGGSPSTVFFSEQGDPGTWNSTWREHLSPGDGEEIVASCVWRDLVFVFKQTKFFVFTQTIDAGGGNPRFMYHSVQANAGAMSPQGVAVGRDGVYFLDSKGVYRTRGEEPELVSWRLDPLFQGLEPPFYRGRLPKMSEIHQSVVGFANERVYVSIPSSTDRALWVYDPRFDWWGYETLPMRCGSEVKFNGQPQLMLARDGTTGIHRQAEGIETDDGAEINGYWQSAWLSLGGLGEKILHRMRLWGNGHISVSAATDFGVAGGGHQVRFTHDQQYWGDGTDSGDTWGDGSDGTDTWGGTGLFKDGWVDWAWKGEHFSFRVGAVAGSPFSVQRAEHHVSVPRRAAHDSSVNVTSAS